MKNMEDFRVGRAIGLPMISLGHPSEGGPLVFLFRKEALIELVQDAYITGRLGSTGTAPSPARALIIARGAIEYHTGQEV